MRGLGRVHEERRRAGGGQRGGDLAAHVAALAHAHDDDTVLAAQDRLDRAREFGGQAPLHAQERIGLDRKGFAGQMQCAFGIERQVVFQIGLPVF
jgi:hypothetical protein